MFTKEIFRVRLTEHQVRPPPFIRSEAHAVVWFESQTIQSPKKVINTVNKYRSHVSARNDLRAEGRVFVINSILIVDCMMLSSAPTCPTQPTFDTSSFPPRMPKIMSPPVPPNFVESASPLLVTPYSAHGKGPENGGRTRPARSALRARAFPLSKGVRHHRLYRCACGDDRRTEQRTRCSSTFSQPRVQSTVCVSSQAMRASLTDLRNAEVRRRSSGTGWSEAKGMGATAMNMQSF